METKKITFRYKNKPYFWAQLRLKESQSNIYQLESTSFDEEIDSYQIKSYFTDSNEDLPNILSEGASLQSWRDRLWDCFSPENSLFMKEIMIWDEEFLSEAHSDYFHSEIKWKNARTYIKSAIWNSININDSLEYRILLSKIAYKTINWGDINKDYYILLKNQLRQDVEKKGGEALDKYLDIYPVLNQCSSYYLLTEHCNEGVYVILNKENKVIFSMTQLA